MDVLMNSIYGSYETYLPTILQTFIQDIEEATTNYKKLWPIIITILLVPGDLSLL